MELNLVVLDGELVAQHLHELDVGAARGAGGNAHLRRRQRDVKRRPDKAAENDRSQDGYEPGVAEERPDPVPHGVSKRFEAHCRSQCVRRRGGQTLRQIILTLLSL